MTELRKLYTPPRLDAVPMLDSYTIAAIIAGMPTHAATDSEASKRRHRTLRSQQRSCANAFADALVKINPTFNRDTFIAAATVTGQREGE